MDNTLPHSSPSSCPCGSGKTYSNCCKPLLDNDSQASTPQQLMRSRYTAFHMGHIEHLLRTLHPDQHQENERSSLQDTIAQTRWLSLCILDAPDSPTNHTSGQVEFVAFYQHKSKNNFEHNQDKSDIMQLHERSNFVKNKGIWLYTQGTLLKPVKWKPNDPCWCHSGKKFKKCHKML